MITKQGRCRTSYWTREPQVVVDQTVVTYFHELQVELLMQGIPTLRCLSSVGRWSHDLSEKIFSSSKSNDGRIEHTVFLHQRRQCIVWRPLPWFVRVFATQCIGMEFCAPLEWINAGDFGSELSTIVDGSARRSREFSSDRQSLY